MEEGARNVIHDLTSESNYSPHPTYQILALSNLSEYIYNYNVIWLRHEFMSVEIVIRLLVGKVYKMLKNFLK